MLDRRAFIVGGLGLGVAAVARPGIPAAESLPGISMASMRGSIDASTLGVAAGLADDQSKVFGKMLQDASDADLPVFLPAGLYVVSNLVLPRKVRLSGVAGATRIVYGGNGHFMLAEAAEMVEMTDLVLDGANRWIGDHALGLLDLRRVGRVRISRCEVSGSSKHGLALERVGGRIDDCRISGAADAGIYSVEGNGLDIRGNAVSDCANGGILVHRWQPAEDRSTVVGNRIDRIAARNGGTGQFGNGINLFRANVVVSRNIISDCAFSAIRANSSSNVQIAGNVCTRLGETAIYSEFAFEGAAITGNIVDGAANGISIVNFDRGGRGAVCADNIVRNLSRNGPYQADAPGFGVGITVEAETTVSGNLIENAPLFGMNLGWGPYLRNVVATGNIIRSAGTGIAVSVVEGAGATLISGNVIDGTPNGAIVGYRWSEPATGDLGSSGNSGYAHLTVAGNHAARG